jgi:hypothetical protein
MNYIRILFNLCLSFFITLFFVKKNKVKYKLSRVSFGGWGYGLSLAKISISLDEVFVVLNTEKGLKDFNITNSPHYKCVTYGDCEDYSGYIDRYFPYLNTKKEVHNLFKLKSTMLKKSVDSPIITYSIKNRKWKVVDGVHRVSVLKSMGVVSSDFFII